MESTWWTKPEDLDDEQKGVIALDKDGNYLVCGPPGCGKTNLLLLRAGYLHRIKRRNFVVLTYGRVLKEFLATGAVHYPFEAGRISTYAAWASALCRAHGLQVPATKDEPQLRAALLTNLQSLKNSGTFSQLDCLLVDEVQDYSADELDVMFALAKQIFLVGDSRQEIYQSSHSITHAKSLVDDAIFLTIHYRNGINICRVADSIVDELDSPAGLEATSQYDEDEYQSTVVTNPPCSVDEQVEIAVTEIANQLIAYPSGYISIMCPRNTDLDSVFQLVSSGTIGAQVQLQKFSEGYSSFDPDRRIILTTMHGAKGLEFRAVHLLAADAIDCFRDRTRRVAYTAVTRAKTYLGVYHSQPLPGFFERALLAADEGPASDPDLSELFVGT